VDLSTTYMGFKLPHPVIVGASPLMDDMADVEKLIDNGAAAIVMHSLFEEQIRLEQEGTLLAVAAGESSSAEALSYFPKPDEWRMGPTQYLAQIGKIKKVAGRTPIIASLNGMTAAGWLKYAKQIQEAGADGLELNVYFLATDADETGEMVERRTLEVLQTVKQSVKIPVALKLSPFYSSIANLARKADQLGVNGLVLFNRFYQPDIDINTLEAVSTLRLSTSNTLLLRLRWLAALSGNVQASLAASGGVHTTEDALKAVMAGAHAVQVVSEVLKEGPTAIRKIRDGMDRWLTEHEYESLAQARGSMSLQKCPDPAIYERANYMKILTGFKRT
jgi:dihydroorotate dehydrogenase (fumarate)